MEKTLIDNSEKRTMQIALHDFFILPDLHTVRIATGYWDLKGLALVKDDLRSFLSKDGTRLQLLIGKDPYIYAGQMVNPKYKNKNYPGDFIRTDIEDLDVADAESKEVVEMLLEFCKGEQPKFDIHIYTSNQDEAQFLHSKCYIFECPNKARAIIGSSNFTQKGLEENSELNYIEEAYMQIAGTTTNPEFKSFIMWFNEKWEQSEPWSQQFIEQVLDPTPLAKQVKKEQEERDNNTTLTPYETYIRILQDKFGALANADVKSILTGYLPPEYDPYEYQLDAAALCYNIMHMHGGFMLGDVVGLGKTIVGVLVIKYYLEFAESEGRDRRVLIVVPPAIKSAWVDTIANFDANREDKIQHCVDFITTGSIGKLTEDNESGDDEENETDYFDGELRHEHYGLILIDESHNFRNNETQMYRALDSLIDEIGADTAYYPYIGLLSATPQNNTPEDLQNQIALFQRTPLNCSFPGVESRNLASFFNDKKERYAKLMRLQPRSETEKQANRAGLIQLSKEIHDKVLTEILVRRTRSDVRDGYHAALHFPEVVGPRNLNYILSPKLAQLFADTMERIAPNDQQKLRVGDDYISFMRYRAIQYLADETLSNRYKGRGGMTPEKTSTHLARIMQILLVKRLESSFSAFRRSLMNLQRYTENMITMWDNDAIFICPQIDVNKELDLEEKRKKNASYTIEQCFEDIRIKIENLTRKGKNDKQQNAEYHRSDFHQEYYQYLLEDKALIDDLVNRWKEVRQDPKLYKFIQSIDTLFNPEENGPQKLVIFSEAVDTVKELEDVVTSAGYTALCITAKNRKDKEQIIRENFDANYKGEWKNDIQVIITTEVLAEGVNLHRANTILNYDTPWNSTRLIQRIGRVNRIGSKEKHVYVYNFYPSAEGDKEINLVNRAFTKLQSFHALFGEDNKVFSADEQLSNPAYKRLIDGDQTPFTRHIVELQKYKEAHPERFEFICNAEIPLLTARHSEKRDIYCVLKTDANTAGSMYVRIKEDGKNEMVSSLELLEAFECEPTATAAQPLPLESFSQKAINTYLAHIHALQQTNKAGQKMFDKALGIIHAWRLDERLNKDSKERFLLAAQYIDKRDKSIAKAVIAISEQIGDPQQLLFPITQDEINAIIAKELKNINERSMAQNGKPYVFAAACQVE